MVDQGNGQFALKPVIRVVDQAINGAITGTVVPAAPVSLATALGVGTVYSTYTDTSGFFMLAGIPAGTYDVIFTPQAPLIQDTVSGVVVVNGQITDLGQIVF